MAQNDWRSRSYLQIASLELALGGPTALGGEVEVRRRRETWAVIDRHTLPQWKEHQFSQLESSTRVLVELLEYMMQSPPMKELARLGDGGPRERLELPAPSPGFPDWRSRSIFQMGQLTTLLGGAEDGEIRRRTGMWFAIERHSWPHMKEAQFAQLELATRTQAELLRYLFQNAEVRDQVVAAKLRGIADPSVVIAGFQGPLVPGAPVSQDSPTRRAVAPDAPTKRVDAPKKQQPVGEATDVSPEKPPGEATFVDVAADVDPLGDLDPVEKYSGPPAQWCYQQGTVAWNDFAQNEYKDHRKARAAAAKLKELFMFLDKNPESEKQMKALEDVVGLSFMEVLNGALERRLR